MTVPTTTTEMSVDGGATPDRSRTPAKGRLPEIKKKKPHPVAKVKVLQNNIQLKEGILLRDPNKKIQNPGDVIAEELAK